MPWMAAIRSRILIRSRSRISPSSSCKAEATTLMRFFHPSLRGDQPPLRARFGRPRISHALTLEVDAFGNVLKEAAVGYGRRSGKIPFTGEDWNKQEQRLITYTENRVTNAIEEADTYRTPLPYEALTFELTGYQPTGPASRYQAADFVEPDPAKPGQLRHIFTDKVAYHEKATSNPCRRPIEQVRTLYRPDDCGERRTIHRPCCRWVLLNRWPCPENPTNWPLPWNIWNRSFSDHISRNCLTANQQKNSCRPGLPICSGQTTLSRLSLTQSVIKAAMWTWTTMAAGGFPPDGSSFRPMPIRQQIDCGPPVLFHPGAPS